MSNGALFVKSELGWVRLGCRVADPDSFLRAGACSGSQSRMEKVYVLLRLDPVTHEVWVTQAKKKESFWKLIS